MTDTLERTDTDVLADLDFAPRCNVRHKLLGMKFKQCENEAVWAGNLPCCGMLGLLCDMHFQTRFKSLFVCGSCGRKHVDLLNWRRL